MMHLGFQTVVWGRRIDDLDHLLAVLAACGYEGVEFGQNHRDIYVRENGAARPIGTFQRLKERCRAHGLELVGLVGGTLDERMAFCGEDRSAYLYVDSWSDEFAAALESDNPFTLALHPHWFMPMLKLSQAEGIMEAVPSPNLKIIIDTAHLCIAEDDAAAAIRRHQSHLASVHIQDWSPDYGRWSHRYARGVCPPGQGIAPLQEVMKTLDTIGFTGWLVMEQDHFEVSKEGTALECASWAVRWAGKDFQCISPNTATVADMEDRSEPVPLHASAKGTLDELEMMRQLSLAEARGPDVFYPMVVRLIRSVFEAEVVKLWSYNPFTDELYLLATSMAAYLPQPSRVRYDRKTCLTGGVIQSTRVTVYDLSDPSVRSRFGDQALLSALRSRCLVAVPVLNSCNAHQVRYVLTIVAERGMPLVQGEDQEDERERLERYADLLSVCADRLTDEMCSAAAGATAHLCGQIRSGVVPFANALTSHIERLFRCDKATVWLLDESRTRLEPVGDTTSRIEWAEGVPETERYYRMGEGLTGQTWHDRQMQFATAPHRAKSFEKTTLNRRECLIAPLAQRGGDLIGVVRLHNKVLQRSGPASTAFTDDDSAKLDAVIQAALPHLDLLIKQQRQSFALTRLAHELQNPLIGITGAADFLRENLRQHHFTDLNKEFGADYIEDLLSYQALMSGLVNNASLFGSIMDELRPQFARTELATMVLIPVKNQLKALINHYHLPEDRIHIQSFQGVIPWLELDRSMLQQVFFNLFVNAIKYNDGIESFRVDVKVGLEGEPKKPAWYVIEVEDWGIGLDEGDQRGESLFLAGVRGKRTSQYRDVSGMGIGLAIVRAVITAHCGTVEFTSPRKPTRLTIRLPGELRHKSPKLIRAQHQ